MADHNRKPATQKRSPGSRKRQRAATCGKDVLELSRLPPEVLSHVFTFLSAEDVIAVSTVCKRWNGLTNSPTLWRFLYMRDFLADIEKLEPDKQLWKRSYFIAATTLKKLDAAITSKNKFGKYMTRAFVHNSMGHFEATVRDFTKAIEILQRNKQSKECNKQPKYMQDNNINIGGLLIRRAEAYRNLKQYDLAKKDADMAIRLAPRNATLYRIRGVWAQEDKRFEDALDEIDKAIALAPSASVYLHCKALILEEMKEYKQAIFCLDKAIELDQIPDYYYKHGRLHAMINNLDKALADMSLAIQLNPNNSDYYHWRGRIRRLRQEYREALEDFDIALKLTGDAVDYAWRSIIHAHLQNISAAFADVNKAISMAQTSFQYQIRGILYYGIDKLEESLHDFNKAIELCPDLSGHYVWRAAIHYEKRDYAALMADLDKAVSLRADEISLFWRGIAHLELGELRKAQYDFAAAYRSCEGPKHSRICFWSAITYSILGQHEDASRMLRETLRTAAAETKASQFSEPARVALFEHKDYKKAKELYKQMFAGPYTWDNAKTEESHLELLAKVAPSKAGELAAPKSWAKKLASM